MSRCLEQYYAYFSLEKQHFCAQSRTNDLALTGAKPSRNGLYLSKLIHISLREQVLCLGASTSSSDSSTERHIIVLVWKYVHDIKVVCAVQKPCYNI
jgi:hypothetical protein